MADLIGLSYNWQIVHADRGVSLCVCVEVYRVILDSGPLSTKDKLHASIYPNTLSLSFLLVLAH